MLLRLHVLRMDKSVIEAISSIDFFEVLLNVKLTWNSDFHLLQSKISKNMGLTYEAKTKRKLLNKYLLLVNS